MSENIEIHGKLMEFLTKDDVIRDTDLVRSIVQDHSDHGGWDTTFKGENWLGTHWHAASEELSAWVGRTFQDLLTFRDEGYNDMCPAEMDYEIVREVTGHIVECVDHDHWKVEGIDVRYNNSSGNQGWYVDDDPDAVFPNTLDDFRMAIKDAMYLSNMKRNGKHDSF